ncbi:hypothetical protein GCM10023191_096040 [Actinoallomurus oryzae]|uniref:Uncharacterized protein n=1 Tax=Actinoallomurus oryzae TaxID=502180 RepID=A0ABP8R6Y7_9ACTN
MALTVVRCAVPTGMTGLRRTERLGLGGDVAGPAEPHPAHLRGPNLTDLAGQPPNIPVTAALPDDQLAGLFGVLRRTRPPRPPMQMLLTSEIPHLSGMRAVLQQHRLLSGHGLESKSHAGTLTTTTDIPRRERRAFPGPKARVSTPRSR